MAPQRTQLLSGIEEACQAGARKASACDVVGLSVRTIQRWKTADHLRDGRLAPNTPPRNKLADIERQRILKLVNQPEYAELPPSKIVPLLADQGLYIASEATFDRVLKSEDLLTHRHKS